MEYDPGYGNALPYGMATPNRQGLALNARHREDSNAVWASSSDLQFLADVKGQGVSNRQLFALADWRNEWRMHRMLKLARPWVMSAGLRFEQSSRPDAAGDAIQSDVSLLNHQVSLQSCWELGSSWSAFAEWQYYQSRGHDYYTVRNAYSEVVDYARSNLDRSEQWLGAGLRYTMSDRFEAQVSTQQFIWRSGSTTLQARYPWNTSQLMLIMKL